MLLRFNFAWTRTVIVGSDAAASATKPIWMLTNATAQHHVVGMRGEGGLPNHMQHGVSGVSSVSRVRSVKSVEQCGGV